MEVPRVDITLNAIGVQAKSEERLQSLQDAALAAIAGLKAIPDGTDTGLSAADGVFLYVGESKKMSPLNRDSALRWICLSALEDAFEILMEACDECHRLCYLAQRGGGPVAISRPLDLEKGLKGLIEATTDDKDILKIDRGKIEDRLAALKHKYDVSFPWEQEIDSLHRARNCLTHRFGVVEAKDCQDGQQLIVHLRKLELFVTDCGGNEFPLAPGTIVKSPGSISMRVVPVSYAFDRGQRISVSASTLSELLTTILWAIAELTGSVAKFVSSRVPSTPPAN